MSWDPWSRPVARAAVRTQECTQIDENSLSAPFWGICVHCWGASCVGWREWRRRSVGVFPRHQPTQTLEESVFMSRRSGFVYALRTGRPHGSNGCGYLVRVLDTIRLEGRVHVDAPGAQTLHRVGYSMDRKASR